MTTTRVLLAVSFAALAWGDGLLAADETVNGNLLVLGTVDIEGNSLTFGSQGASYGAGLVYTDSSTDTLSFHLNRESASWLWAHSGASGAVNVMRLASNHDLALYGSDGVTAGIRFSPNNEAISIGSVSLHSDIAGVLRINVPVVIEGSLSASSYSLSSGSIASSLDGLHVSSGSAAPNIHLEPSVGGNVVVDGNLRLGQIASPAKLAAEIEGGGIAMEFITPCFLPGRTPVLFDAGYQISFGSGAVLGSSRDAFAAIDQGAMHFSSAIYDPVRGAVNPDARGAFVFKPGYVLIGTDLNNARDILQVDGSIGSLGHLELNAGGLDNDVVLRPSGVGNVVLHGNVGVGETEPVAKLAVNAGSPGIGDAVILLKATDAGGGAEVYSSVAFGADPNGALSLAGMEFKTWGSNGSVESSYTFKGNSNDRDVRINNGKILAPEAQIAGDTKILGNLRITGVARVMPAGDIPMTGFMSGPTPND